jgi:hypothetical protein
VLGSSLVVWQTFIHLVPTKSSGRELLEDHDPAKIHDTPLSAHHPRSVDMASRVADQQDYME